MKPVYLLAALLLLTTACQKKDVAKPNIPTYTEPDFALIPTKDATWYVHLQGNYNDWYDDVSLFWDSQSGPDQVDTAVHEYITVKALGQDTIVDGYTYHIYQLKIDFHYSIDSLYNKFLKQRYPRYSKYYLREDTLAKKVFFGFQYGSPEDYYLVADFSDDANTGQVKPGLTWPLLNIMKPGVQHISGMALKSWDAQAVYDGRKQYFYKALGIGSMSGVIQLGWYADNWAQVRDLSFVYHNDSLHFEYPLNQ